MKTLRLMKTQPTHTHERTRLHKNTHRCSHAGTRARTCARTHKCAHKHTLTHTLLPPFALGNSWWLLHNLLVQLFPGFHFLPEYQWFTLRSVYLQFGSYRGNIPICGENPDSFLSGSVWMSVNYFMNEEVCTCYEIGLGGGGWERRGSHLKLPATSWPQR